MCIIIQVFTGFGTYYLGIFGIPVFAYISADFFILLIRSFGSILGIEIDAEICPLAPLGLCTETDTSVDSRCDADKAAPLLIKYAI